MGSSPAEEKLARLLAKRGWGVRFRRQVPIDGYILDFYCAKRRLAIEVDGGEHKKRKKHDSRRDAALAAQNIRTLRVLAKDVMNVGNRVIREVEKALGARFYRQHTKSTETIKKLKLRDTVGVSVQKSSAKVYKLTREERNLLLIAELRSRCLCRVISTRGVDYLFESLCSLTADEHLQVQAGDEVAQEAVREARKTECRKDL